VVDSLEYVSFAGGRLTLVREPQVEQALPLREAIVELGATLLATPQQHLINQPRVRIVPPNKGEVWLNGFAISTSSAPTIHCAGRSTET
jgi:hypothetical protein